MRELLPHVFTLIRLLTDGNFLWHLLLLDRCQSNTFPLGSMVLCAVPTFLGISCRDNRCCCAKVSQNPLLQALICHCFVKDSFCSYYSQGLFSRNCMHSSSQLLVFLV